MKKKFENYLPHFIIWIIIIAYLVFSPVIYTIFFLKEGKDIRFAGVLPQSTDQIKYSVDRLDTVVLNGNELLNLWGWSFYQNDENQADYEKFIVFTAGTKQYFFSAIPLQRADLKKAFKEIKFDLSQSGFSFNISKEILPTSVYEIGILYKHKTNGSLYYIITNTLLNVTKNNFELVKGNSPTITNSLSNTANGDGNPNQIKLSLPKSSKQINYFIDYLALVQSKQIGLYYISGWAFYQAEANQALFERILVLKSTSQNYYFNTTPISRPDVQDAYKNIKFDISNSGFGANISKSAINPGTYQIGIVFQNKKDNSIQYVETNRSIIVTTDKLEMSVP